MNRVTCDWLTTAESTTEARFKTSRGGMNFFTATLHQMAPPGAI